jgi:hypothetical protein
MFSRAVAPVVVCPDVYKDAAAPVAKEIADDPFLSELGGVGRSVRTRAVISSAPTLPSSIAHASASVRARGYHGSEGTVALMSNTSTKSNVVWSCAGSIAKRVSLRTRS